MDNDENNSWVKLKGEIFAVVFGLAFIFSVVLSLTGGN